MAADDPQLTVATCPAKSPASGLRSGRRLATTYRVFTDDTGRPCMSARGRSSNPARLAWGRPTSWGSIATTRAAACAEVVRLLRARGCCARIRGRRRRHGFGVSQANLLDRLQIAIAPVIIGDGRPAIRLAPHARLSDCRRPRYRVFRMGGDVLFDCDLQADADPLDGPSAPVVNQVI